MKSCRFCGETQGCSIYETSCHGRISLCKDCSLKRSKHCGFEFCDQLCWCPWSEYCCECAVKIHEFTPHALYDAVRYCHCDGGEEEYHYLSETPVLYRKCSECNTLCVCGDPDCMEGQERCMDCGVEGCQFYGLCKQCQATAKPRRRHD